MLQVLKACKTFNAGTPDARQALDALSLELKTGQFVTIIGSNGAGKSTLLNAISGDVNLDSGQILIDGRDVTRLPTYLRARWVARVFQDPMLGTAPGMSIEENLALAELRGDKRGFRWGLQAHRRARYRDMLATLQLGLEDRPGAKAGTLSGGQRQSLSLLMAVIKQPSLLLLDEHIAALDPRTAGIVMEATTRAVSAFNLTTLMVTHNMQQALQYGDRLVILQSGRVRLAVEGAEKTRLSVEDLVERFHMTSDEFLLV